MAIASKMAMTSTTTISSMKVNPPLEFHDREPDVDSAEIAWSSGYELKKCLLTPRDPGPRGAPLGDLGWGRGALA